MFHNITKGDPFTESDLIPSGYVRFSQNKYFLTIWHFFKIYTILKGKYRANTLFMETCEDTENRYRFDTNIYFDADSSNRQVIKGYVVVPKDTQIQKVIISQ